VEAAAIHYGQQVLGWRDVPVDHSALGRMAQASCPVIRQLFIERRGPAATFERTLFLLRKRAERTARGDDFYVVSCSARTVIYKGLLLAEQLAPFYTELVDPRCTSRLALVHSRFSTNTFPTWDRAHPFRLLAHNGEINTLRGNRAWMAAREALLAQATDPAEREDLLPVIQPGGSDSAALDNVAEFLFVSGRSLPHVMMMLVPEAWSHDASMNDSKRAFYEYHGGLMEPWDGPAALCFSDGRLIGATLDRNGLRPAKYVVTSDGLVVLGSEFGVLEIDPALVVKKGRLQPGKMFLVDTEAGTLISDDEIKHHVVNHRPYRQWLRTDKIELTSLPVSIPPPSAQGTTLAHAQRLFAYTHEDIALILAPMAQQGEEPTGSMGIDIPLAVLSAQPQLLFRYFKQHFAQVTNPPIDPIREELVMSLVSYVGGAGDLLDDETPQCRMIELPHPILLPEQYTSLACSGHDDLQSTVLRTCFSAEDDPEHALRSALEALMRQAVTAVRESGRLLLLSDRTSQAHEVPIPSLLATAAVHHALLRAGLRLRAGLIVEAGDVREVAHAALLVGYGAAAFCPYVAFDTIASLQARGELGATMTLSAARENYIKALKKGMLKVMSKMGISALSSYQGAQIFEAVGLDQQLIDRYFTGTPSRLRGIGLREIAEDARQHHAAANDQDGASRLPPGGHLQLRTQGETHLWNATTVAALQKAVRIEDQASYDRYAHAINEQGTHPTTLRGLWNLRPAGPALPLDQIEPATDIIKRFATGAMSFGSISKEAHETLAIAMNRVGGRSNTGEGGEDEARFLTDAKGDKRRSAVKQVASARFGVSAHYLVNADEIQIKIAQGAKPGEGGQLPGHKVDSVIARVRHSIPGVTLISPPPHHDIYSIEDLAQLIFDLKNVNPRARVSVKLVSEAGVGTIAAGVAKASADAVLISGHDGGTGASPLTSIHHAGLPWELGLAEIQQVLLLNGLRGRVRLQVDGQLKTGRDVLFGALLGAEEFGFATAPLVALGCIMMRKCHLNTCPVGVATQDPVLRERFAGQPEHVIRYLTFVAEEVRALLASLGLASLDQAVGRVDLIVPRQEGLSLRARRVDSSEVLYNPNVPAETARRCTEGQVHNLSTVADRELLVSLQPALDTGRPMRATRTLHNRDRAFGSMLSGEIARRYGSRGLPDETITLELTGSAGQSFGAFLAAGITLQLSGDANDYVGKGLSGGIIVVRVPANGRWVADENVIVGNTVLYGAIAGKAFFQGCAGERFAVRNSGAMTVVEGVGDHGCEYMTGGTVVILGPTGRNFAAGMSGGTAYVLARPDELRARCHPERAQAIEPLRHADDLEALRGLLEEHAARTGSQRARSLLAGWPATAQQFVTLLPPEYGQALAALKAKRAASPTTNLREVSHG